MRIGKLPGHVARNMRAWEHSGFSLHLVTRVRATKREGLVRLATYMRRHPFSPKGIRYQPETGKLVYRAPRMHAGKKQNFAVFDAVDFLAASRTTSRIAESTR